MKAERRQETKNRPNEPRLPGEDPGIAGIVPGPQRRPDDELLGELLLVDDEAHEPEGRELSVYASLAWFRLRWLRRFEHGLHRLVLL